MKKISGLIFTVSFREQNNRKRQPFNVSECGYIHIYEIGKEIFSETICWTCCRFVLHCCIAKSVFI